MVGVSPGNGHPFSFSAIINGYDPERFAEADWPVIDQYLQARDPSEFGVPGLEVTHAWTEDAEVTRRLRDSCGVKDPVASLDDMVSRVDAVIIARDDHERHVEMALPFLRAGIPTFLDKPLSLDPEELSQLRPYLEDGLLMSCSGMRYALELDPVRLSPERYGDLKLIRGAIVLDWEKYGVHLLDAVGGAIGLRPISVTALPARHASMAVALEDGILLQIDAMGAAPRVFRVEFFGTEGEGSHDIADNFTMFRRLLVGFGAMVEDRQPPVPVEEVLDTMRVLIAGQRSRAGAGTVLVDQMGI